MKLVHGVEKLPGPGSIPRLSILEALGQDHLAGQAVPPGMFQTFLYVHRVEYNVPSTHFLQTVYTPQ